MTSDNISSIVFSLVMACWCVFAAAFIFRKRPPKSRETKRDNAARSGLVLEAVGYAIVWMYRRPISSPFLSMGVGLEIGIALVAVALAVGSVWMVLSAVRTLGKQWSVAARLVEGHTLITDGPYSVVRNPIYAGMFGMMIATGLAVSYWWILPPAIVVFWVGTMMRVRSEEKLLREAFDNEFETYARRVPALLPNLIRKRE